MSEFLVTLKATAEVTGSVLVEAENEFEASVKAASKAKKDFVSWMAPKPDMATVKCERIFYTGK